MNIKGTDEIDFTKLKDKYDGIEISTFVNCDKDFDTVSKSLESKNIFIWRYGAIEDAILETFKKDKEKETTFLGESEPKNLKKQLKLIHNENDRQTFYDRLMELSEIKRFISFFKDKGEHETFDSLTCHIFRQKAAVIQERKIRTNAKRVVSTFLHQSM